jgi:3-phosphoshikimate 1-carboxyvinyltransferase
MTKPNWIKIQSLPPISKVKITLPLSKSLSNRILILSHFCRLYEKELPILSDSRDTQLLQKALYSNSESLDFMDAGTPSRLALAYFAATGRLVTITGNQSLKNRSIRPLVNALILGGAEIEYLENAGFFPVRITKKLSHFPENPINRSESSQFVTALLLVSVLFSGDKHLYLQGTEHSNEYISMTLQVLKEWGIESSWKDDVLTVFGGCLTRPLPITVEADWSAASYFYALQAMQPEHSFFLEGLTTASKQGDRALSSIFQQFGVESLFETQGVQLQFVQIKKQNLITLDLADVPDVVPSIVVAAVGRNQELLLKGIQNLKYKESNRIDVMNENLQCFGWQLEAQNDHDYLLKQTHIPQEKVYIHTHGDHRMAMAFSLLATKQPLFIDDIECVEKSFPLFWKALQSCNFELNLSENEPK